MSQYQVYLNDEQKNYLIKYIHERRCVSMAFMSLLFLGIFGICSYGGTFLNALRSCGEGLVYFVLFGSISIGEFVKGFGKTFGYRCDIHCIEKDLYILDHGDFGYREKDNGKHPYYICDNNGGTYICPKFLDYKNADTSDKFLYIELDNGRGYAIGDYIYMK